MLCALQYPVRAGSGSMGRGSVGQVGHFLDGSRGSWVIFFQKEAV